MNGKKYRDKMKIIENEEFLGLLEMVIELVLASRQKQCTLYTYCNPNLKLMLLLAPLLVAVVYRVSSSIIKR